VVDSSYPYLISLDWDRGYRARRITEMIGARDRLSAEDIERIQGDNKSLSAGEIIPYLTALTPDEPELRSALARLAVWDLQEDRDSPDAALYEMTWTHLVGAIFDELPDDLRPDGDSWTMVLVKDLLAQPESHWWDDRSTAAVETQSDILLRALKDGYAWLEERYGKDMDAWAWGKLHTATFENQSLGQAGIGPIEAIFNRGPIPANGGTAQVNNTAWSFDDPAMVRGVPSERMVLDVANWQSSETMHTTGQSGHPFHKHYGDMILPWRDIEYHTMQWERSAIEADAEGVLQLQP
jgi:penicillin amidase